jgi:microcin C transport system permease protein
MKLSPLTQKRIANFKNNKRGYYCFLIFLFFFIITLPAEFLANDKPIYISYKNQSYFPVVKFYPETTFGGAFETEANYKDETLLEEIKNNGFAIWPPIKFSYDSINYNLTTPFPAPPSWQNLLGTDDQGRDVLARIIYGFRISVLFGLILTILSSAIGVVAGALQGYFGGLLDLFFQRFMEIWGSMPTLFMLIILAGFVQPSFWILLVFILLFSWMSLVGVVRAEILKTRNFDYVTAAKALGVRENRIIFKHILPNSIVATITFMPFILSGSVTTLTSLDFLGFGLPVGSPSLGELLAQGKANLQAPWLGVTAFFVIASLLSLLIFFGEAVRDAFNPNKIFRR